MAILCGGGVLVHRCNAIEHNTEAKATAQCDWRVSRADVAMTVFGA